MAAMASSMVAGKRSLISWLTFWRDQMVSPRSPFTRRPRNIRYWV